MNLLNDDFLWQVPEGVEKPVSREPGNAQRQQMATNMVSVTQTGGHHTVKKVRGFPVPRRDVPYQTPIGRKYSNLIIPCQGEFGKWHPGWGRENQEPFFTVQYS